MGTPPPDLYVTETCIPFKKKDCNPANTDYTFMIDPCSCYHYYDCVANFNVLRRPCPNGTALNHNQKRCDFTNIVIVNGICDNKTPWKRCNVTDTELERISKRCGANVTTPVPTEGLTPLPLENSHTGLIIGGILGGIFLVAFFVLFYMVWRKKIPIFKPREESKPVQNPEYFAKTENIYDEYSEIDDTVIHSSTNAPSLPKRPASNQNSISSETTANGCAYNRKISSASTGYVEPVQTMKRQDFGYDNSNFRLKEESGDNGSSDGHTERMYVDILDNNNTRILHIENKHTDVRTDISDENRIVDDYFILEKDEHMSSMQS